MKDPYDLLEADLERSGIEREQWEQLGLEVLTPKETKKITGKYSVPSYKIPYFDIDGNTTDFFRLRLLSDKGRFGAKISQRYYQPSGTLPGVYMPPLFSWAELADDPTIPVYITEGEKKAAKACGEGLATMGLGGVWSWKSKKARLPHLPEFDAVEWEGRQVIIVFDSDMRVKPQIVGAMHALAKELLRLGAVPYYISLEDEGDKKVGLDDYLLTHSPAEFEDIPLEEFELVQELWRFNTKFAVLEQPISVFNLLTGETMRLQDFTNILTANERMTVVDSRGDVKEVAVSAEWLKWPYRQCYERPVFAPGEPRNVGRNYNTWRGWGAEPVKGDVSLWDELLEFIFSTDPEAREWFEQWAAYPIQHPGTKIYSAVLLHSTQTGVGKSLIGETLGRVYGEHFRSIKRENIVGRFNEWAINAQFVLADEISSMNKRKDVDLLKNLITNERVTIDKKFQPTFVLEDCINYIFTSQHVDAMYVEEKDRRFFVHEVPKYRKPAEFYAKFDRWFHSEEGVAALYYYLLHDVDCGDFNPKAEPPMTWAKRDMIELSASNLDLWCRELRDRPSNVLRNSHGAIPCDLWTVEDLLTFYDLEGHTKVGEVGLAIALKRAGLSRLNRVALSDGRSVTLWAVRNADKWNRAHSKKIIAHYESRGKK